MCDEIKGSQGPAPAPAPGSRLQPAPAPAPAPGDTTTDDEIKRSELKTSIYLFFCFCFFGYKAIRPLQDETWLEISPLSVAFRSQMVLGRQSTIAQYFVVLARAEFLSPGQQLCTLSADKTSPALEKVNLNTVDDPANYRMMQSFLYAHPGPAPPKNLVEDALKAADSMMDYGLSGGERMSPFFCADEAQKICMLWGFCWDCYCRAPERSKHTKMQRLKNVLSGQGAIPPKHAAVDAESSAFGSSDQLEGDLAGELELEMDVAAPQDFTSIDDSDEVVPLQDHGAATERLVALDAMVNGGDIEISSDT